MAYLWLAACVIFIVVFIYSIVKIRQVHKAFNKAHILMCTLIALGIGLRLSWSIIVLVFYNTQTTEFTKEWLNRTYLREVVRLSIQAKSASIFSFVFYIVTGLLIMMSIAMQKRALKSVQLVLSRGSNIIFYTIIVAITVILIPEIAIWIKWSTIDKNDDILERNKYTLSIRCL